jgi:predicted phosphodiesterase
MRIGLFSDVHGNLAALEVALAALREEGVERLMCPGDLVGYGPFPNECVSLVAESGALCVAGNHDLMAIDRLDDSRAGTLAKRTLAWTRSVLTADARRYLEELPPMAELGSLVMAHGSLDDPSFYVEREHAAAELERLARARPGASLLLLGHTHTPLAHAERGGTLLEGRRGRVEIADGQRMLVNPGSVGQPREWRALVRFAVVDLDARSVEFRAAGYDDQGCRRALAERGLPEDACHRRPPLGRAMRRELELARVRLRGLG